MFECLELKIAKSKIDRYEQEAEGSIIHESRQAVDCLDCEEFLDKGIAALGWLQRSEEVLLEASAECVFENHPQVETAIELAIETLYAAWLRPCEKAEAWIASCQGNGYSMRNVEVFRDCCDRVSAWLEQNLFYKESKVSREERFAEENW